MRHDDHQTGHGARRQPGEPLVVRSDRRSRRPRLVVLFALAAAATLALQAVAYAVPAGLREELFATTWIAAAAVALATALVCVRVTGAPLRRSWLIWAAAVGAWLAGAALHLAAAATGSHGLETAAGVAWLVLPVVAGLSIAFDAPRGSLSFGLFLLDALPIVLLVTMLVRFATPHPLEQAHLHELLNLGYPFLYVLVALVGVQLLLLERNGLRSPNLLGFGVAQPLLAVAAVGWPLAEHAGSGRWFPWEAFWTLGLLAAGAAAARRAGRPDDVPELGPLDDNGLRAIPAAVGVLGLLVVTAASPTEYVVVPAALAIVSLGCLTARAIVVQKEHRLAHATLAENAEQLRTVVGNVPGAVYRARLDADWTIEFMSDEIESLTGHPAAAFLLNREQSFGTIEHPEDTASLNRHIRSRVEAGRPYAYEYRVVRADGGVRWVLDRGQAAYGRDGRPLWVDGVLLDISEQKAAEERLERQTELLWLLQRVAVAANEAREPEEAFQVCADEVCASTGWPVGHVLVRPEESEEVVSTGIWHLDDPGAMEAFRAESERRAFPPGTGLPGRVLASGRAEWVADFADESLFPRAPHAAELGLHAAFAFPVLVGSEVVGVLEFFAPTPEGRDENLLRIMAHIGTVLGRVVERTRAERALAAQNDALRQLDSLKDEFVSLVSHELRTPLTSIRGYLELVLDDEETPLPEEHRTFLGVVQRNADRLLRLVGDLLFVAQVDAGRLALEREELDLAAVAAECVQAAEPVATRRQVRVALEAAPTALVGDRARLSQLVDNLLSNAIKFSPEGGAVTLRVGAAGERASLEVADGGIGIPADEQEQLFERFFRSSNARRAAVQGTGLGLVIVRAIAEAHGGSVTVTSLEGEGTTFRVELPLTAPRQDVSADESAPAERIALQEAL